MAEALLQSAVKRALEQSVSGTNNLTSTPQKSNQGLNSKRSKMDVALAGMDKVRERGAPLPGNNKEN